MSSEMGHHCPHPILVEEHYMFKLFLLHHFSICTLSFWTDDRHHSHSTKTGDHPPLPLCSVVAASWQGLPAPGHTGKALFERCLVATANIQQEEPVSGSNTAALVWTSLLLQQLRKL